MASCRPPIIGCEQGNYMGLHESLTLICLSVGPTVGLIWDYWQPDSGIKSH